MNEKYDKKYAIFKEFGNLVNSFMEKKNDLITNGSYYLKIKELYNILEVFAQFDSIFEHLKDRLKAIKAIHDKSDQFKSLLDTLNNLIKNNEVNLGILSSKYETTFKSFEDFNNLILKINEFDTIIKQKF